MLPNRTIAFSRSSWEDRAALVEDGAVVEIEIERRDAGLRPGDVYAGRLRRVVSGLDAAFVDLGDERPAYLPLPASERTRLGALPRGRTLLVQVVKAPLGGKGARVSAAPVLSSQSWVLNTGSKGVAISRKIADAAERDRLRGIGARFSDAGYGWIARTAAAGRSEVSLAHEASVLLERWRELESAAATIVPPQRLQPELDLPFRWLRDRLDVPGTRIVVDGAELGAELGRRMEGAGTRASVDVEAGPDSGGAFAALGIDRALREAVSRIVRLPSGGHVTIDRTEALTVVDVDTGRSVGTRDLENTILATNLEAARAIARQIRLRNMGGIVVIDFIDMAVASNCERVSNELRAGFATDPSPVEILPFTPFGLVQLTRKRTRPSLDEQLLAECPRCAGSGRVPAAAAVGARVLRALESRLEEDLRVALVVRTSQPVVDWLRREAAVTLQALERRGGRAILVRNDERITAEFVIEPPRA